MCGRALSKTARVTAGLLIVPTVFFLVVSLHEMIGDVRGWCAARDWASRVPRGIETRSDYYGKFDPDKFDQDMGKYGSAAGVRALLEAGTSTALVLVIVGAVQVLRKRSPKFAVLLGAGAIGALVLFLIVRVRAGGWTTAAYVFSLLFLTVYALSAIAFLLWGKASADCGTK